jgi:membrane protease YdiL (CAAX protease family)
MSQPAPSAWSVCSPWLKTFVVSWVVGLGLVIPIFSSIWSYYEANARHTVWMFWNEPTQDSFYPDEDSALEAWLAGSGGLTRVVVERTRPDGKTRIKSSWRGALGWKEVPFEELGYRQPWATDSQLVSAKIKIGWGSWVMVGSVLASLGYLFFGVRAWRKREAPPAKTMGKGILAGSVGLGVVFAGLGALSGLAGSLGGSPLLLPWDVLILVATLPLKLLYTGIAVVVVPLACELFFRHALYSRLAAAGHERGGALVSSAMQALPLVIVPLAGLILFLQGLVCCHLYKRTGRLAAPLALSTTTAAVAFCLYWINPLGLASISGR